MTEGLNDLSSDPIIQSSNHDTLIFLANQNIEKLNSPKNHSVIQSLNPSIIILCSYYYLSKADNFVV
ncbi:hypothetical protein BDD43_2898 [Mucilaginibacter gracilis]|uniref:Uncharacterized protein n=1 Tax=Mucilaginibacter gracilis TaxID=423350 RepID=A0A495J1N4_9SPHI|nr:hypothetical protein BDD43_2898 [Mucilaginibacter gracilis]